VEGRHWRWKQKQKFSLEEKCSILEMDKGLKKGGRISI
jgi:hypothetical protein